MFQECWYAIRDGDRRAFNLYLRHYSSEKNKKNKPDSYFKNARFCAPGERMVLMTSLCDALFVWHKQKYRLDNQYGINCAVFRNESNKLSSKMILEAERLAWQRWPNDTRLFTFVDTKKIKSKNPGYCFKCAGWSLYGKSADGKLILEKFR